MCTMKIGKCIDWVVFLSSLVGLVMEFLYPSIVCVPGCILGCIGILYCVYYLFMFFCLPIRRDWILAKGSFLIKVVNFVLLIPFVFTLVFSYSCISKSESNIFSPKNLVFDENLYTFNDKAIDTLGVANNEVSRNLLFQKTHNLETINDSIIIQKNKISDHEILKQEDPSLFWAIYYHFIDPGNQHMTTSETGRKIAALIAILGFLLLNGLLVSTLISWFDRRREQWIKGEINYRYFKRWWRLRKHYIVIGGSDMVVGIVKQLLKKNILHQYPYVIIQTSSDIDTLRRELFSILTEQQQKYVVLYYGSSTSPDDLLRLGFNNAEEVYIVGEDNRQDDVDSYHDTINMECLNLICEIVNPNNKWWNKIGIARSVDKKLLCRVMFEYQTTFSIFQFSDISDKIRDYINFRPFNYYETWAQRVLVNTELKPAKILDNFASESNCFLPLDGADGITCNSNAYVHLFVVGMSRMGVAMGIEAAHLAHFPNYTEQNKIRTKITFIDTNIVDDKDFLIGRFKELFKLSHWRYGTIQGDQLSWNCPHLPEKCDHLGGDFIDVEWEFVNGGIEQNAVQNYVLSSTELNAKVTIAICLPESNKSHAAALYLDKKIYESKNLLQVLVYNRYGNAIIKSLQTKETRFPYQNKLKVFGASKDCVDLKYIKQIEKLGTAIGDKYTQIKNEYINKAVKEAGQEDIEKREKDTKGYGGKSEAANFWSNIYNANTMWTKLRSVNFDGIEYSKGDNHKRGDEDILADVEHNRWNMEQLLMNFRPLTSIEQSDVLTKKKTKNQCKQDMAHLNICSNKCLIEKLKEIDVVARAYDVGLTALLPELYKFYNEESSKNE